MVHQVWRSVRT